MIIINLLQQMKASDYQISNSVHTGRFKFKLFNS